MKIQKQLSFRRNQAIDLFDKAKIENQYFIKRV